MGRHSSKHIRRFMLFPISVIVVGLLVWFLKTFFVPFQTSNETEFGMTFSTKYATELGLDWQDVYLASLDELGIRLFRIPVYWDEIETTEGNIDLSNVEWMLEQAEERDAKVILAIGSRAPRWPECHPPTWTSNMPREEMEAAELRMIEYVVQEFKDSPALLRWQVHNEAFFSVFGECPSPNSDFIARSILRVREIDPYHRIMTTDSGELSTWFRTAAVADVLGVSMYRVTWNSFWGYFYYPIPPSFYIKKAKLVDGLVDKVIVSELQTEPWVPSTILTTSLDEQFRSMNPVRLRANVDFARKVGFEETLLWGVEWWYWLRQVHSQPEMWNAGAEIFAGE